jgi:hypothetical protein
MVDSQRLWISQGFECIATSFLNLMLLLSHSTWGNPTSSPTAAG